MDKNRLGLRIHHSGSSQSDESALDLERNYCIHRNSRWSSPSPLQPFASGGQHSETEDRANYFGNLQKGVLPETLGGLPKGQQATTLLELMTIRAFHSKILRRFIHRQWLSHVQCLPAYLEVRKLVLPALHWPLFSSAFSLYVSGPGGVWCDVDVVEFSYYGAPAATPNEQLYTELVDGLRGSDPCIGSGSQVWALYRTGNRQVGFLTNRHVAVDLDYPNQKMFHPLPPSLGPGVYLGAVERATSFITDELWYAYLLEQTQVINNNYATCFFLHLLTSTLTHFTLAETFVRADGAFIPFAEDFNMNNVNITVKGVGEVGDVHVIDLQAPINSLIGRQVVKVGRKYNDEKGICFFTDFLVVGENQQTFDLEGDSGSLILLTGQDCEKPRPVGIIWGGTANRGRLKLKVGQPPENWTSGVDLGRLLDLLELDLITTNEGLQAAIQDQRNVLAPGIDSTVGDSSPLDQPLNLNIQQVTGEGESQQGQTPLFIGPEFHIEDAVEATPNVEHQFIPSFSGRSPMYDNTPQENPELENLSALRSDSDEPCFSLHLGEPELKRKNSQISLLALRNRNEGSMLLGKTLEKWSCKVVFTFFPSWLTFKF
ncbi:protein NARROW LEAF [Salix suchowensis]|nr:protein NARROW LEAF [Salix suchowensis]